MKSDHRVRSNKVNDFLADMLARYDGLTEHERPQPEADVLFESDYEHVEATCSTYSDPDNIKQASSCANCDLSRTVSRGTRKLSHEPVVFYGLIASGNSPGVIKYATERDRIRSDCDGAFCFEMEAVGVMNDFPCIVVRGICDYCDSHKNDSWHSYAAAAAAGIAKELLGYLAPNPFWLIQSARHW